MNAIQWAKRVSIFVALSLAAVAEAGQFVRVSPDLQIHYEEAGSGTPLVFVPGWSSSMERACSLHPKTEEGGKEGGLRTVRG